MAPGIEWLAMPEEWGDPPETGHTFEANALQKARFVFERSGEFALADDSGLSVDALGGRPGVFSKRYSEEGTDEANNRKLLGELLQVAARTARYHCVIALVGPEVSLTCAGTCEGRIGHQPQGSGGFGYDPLFWPVEIPGRTMAQLSPQEKDAISHRGKAMAGLPGLLRKAGL